MLFLGGGFWWELSQHLSRAPASTVDAPLSVTSPSRASFPPQPPLFLRPQDPKKADPTPMSTVGLRDTSDSSPESQLWVDSPEAQWPLAGSSSRNQSRGRSDAIEVDPLRGPASLHVPFPHLSAGAGSGRVASSRGLDDSFPSENQAWVLVEAGGLGRGGVTLDASRSRAVSEAASKPREDIKLNKHVRFGGKKGASMREEPFYPFIIYNIKAQV